MKHSGVIQVSGTMFIKTLKCSSSLISQRFSEKLLRYRGVATWSPLASAFNTKPSRVKSLRSEFLGENTGLFGYRELQQPNGFHLLKENALVEADRLVREAQSSQRTRKMVQVFDQLSDTLCKVADLAEFVRIGHPSERYAHAAGEASVSISGLVEELNTNRDLYDKLKNVVEYGDICSTDAVDDHVAKLFLFDFEQCGIHLDKAKRERVVSLNNYILHVGSNFMNRTLHSRSVLKSQLPEDIRHCFATEGESVLVSGLFADSENELVREAAYKIYLFPEKHQEELLDLLLSARHELATLCGFPTYAHRAVKGSMAGSPQFVNDFLQNLKDSIKPKAEDDYAKMLEMKKSVNKYSKDLMMWDVPYFIAKTKHKKYNVKGSDYCPYFSLGACMDGINNVFSALYDVTLNVEDAVSGEIWHDDVRKLAVCEENEILGYIYCDFFERPGKPNQDCHFTIQGGRLKEDGTYQKPIVVLMLNLPNPTWNTPSLLTPSMVDNLFHEMGHAMHSMLARTTYQHVTGTRCSTDLAEVPSVLMEYFSSDHRVVSQFARHYQTGKLIPVDLLNKLRSSKRMFSACETQLQVFYAALDQAYHRVHPLGSSTTEVLAKIQNTYYGLPHIPNTAWQLRFGHLVGYGAKYYSYLMSRAVASWIWHQCFIDNPFNKKEGKRYRKEILAHGGSIPPQLLIKEFLRKDVTPEALSEALVKDIDDKSCNEV